MQSQHEPEQVEEPEAYVAPGLPREIDLAGEPLVLRRMTPEDANRMHRFFLELPAVDLLVLDRDVTQGREIDTWVDEMERGETVTIIAETPELAGVERTIMGETTLHLSSVPWSRHIGYVRVFTAREQRGRGLGRLLLDELCQLASNLGVEKLVAEMTVEQVPAQRLLEQLGFVEEARLRNYVKDRYRRPHDLVIMTRDVCDLDVAPFGDDERPAAWCCTACGNVTRAADPPNFCHDCGAGAGFLLRADEE